MGLAHLLFTVTLTFGEYRAFMLEITTPQKTAAPADPNSPTVAPTEPPATGAKKRVIITNLDQYQYPQYYPLEAGETIVYMDSWMCWERTGSGRPPCPQRNPANAVAAPPGPQTNSQPPKP